MFLILNVNQRWPRGTMSSAPTRDVKNIYLLSITNRKKTEQNVKFKITKITKQNIPGI